MLNRFRSINHKIETAFIKLKKQEIVDCLDKKHNPKNAHKYRKEFDKYVESTAPNSSIFKIRQRGTRLLYKGTFAQKQVEEHINLYAPSIETMKAYILQKDPIQAENLGIQTPKQVTKEKILEPEKVLVPVKSQQSNIQKEKKDYTLNEDDSKILAKIQAKKQKNNHKHRL